MDSIATPSAYDDNRPALIANGYHPLPIGPGTKKPMVIVEGEYRDMVQWQAPERSMAPTPQPGAGLGVRLGLQRGGAYLVAIDWDDDGVAIAGLSEFPSAVCKEGRRGNTTFFVAHREILSKDFRVGGNCVVQVLGKQTVLPPSIHPDTGRPYFWSAARTLFDTRIESLPELPEDYIAKIEGAIRLAGLNVDVEEPPKQAPPDGYDDDSPFKRLNDAALGSLSVWVPDLGLYRCRKKPGRYISYEAVATWRPSKNGRPDEQRGLNLQIAGRGIKDFGTGKGYSPINLVMAAHNCDRDAAYDWLAERVLPGPHVDADAIRKAQEEKKSSSTKPDAENVESPSIEPDVDASSSSGTDANDCSERQPDLSLIGEPWVFGDPTPPQLPMLVPGILPARGWGVLGGSWGTYKTFVANDLAVAVASGGKFAGEQVAERGVAIQIELEGSNSEVRISAAAKVREVTGPLPVALFRRCPPKIAGNNRVSPEFKKWCSDIIAYGQHLAAKHGVRLALITIDPIGRLGGNEKEAVDTQAVADGCYYLSEAADCAVLILDHYGKVREAGLTGSVRKETNALFILGTAEREAPPFLEVRKMKNGIENVRADFVMNEIDVSIRQRTLNGDIEDVIHSTLAVEWTSEPRPYGEEKKSQKEAKPEKPKTQSEQCMDELRELMAGTFTRVASGEAPGGYAVPSALWQAAADGIGINAVRFSQIKGKLKAEGRIGEDIEARVVWIALGLDAT